MSGNVAFPSARLALLSIIDVSDDFTDKGGAGETGAVSCPVAPPPR